MRVMRLVVPVAVLCLSACGTAASTADPEPGAGEGREPSSAEGRAGPHGPSNHGLCTAYFAGSSEGRAEKHSAPPFVALEEAAAEAGQSVRSWCTTHGSKPGKAKKPPPADR